jgi:ATP-dependent protease ClpP protease subunit
MKIRIDGIIGWDITAEDIIKKLPDGGEALEIDINSDGGSVMEAFSIYNALKNYKGAITITINAKALSAAAYLVFAADTIKVYANSVFMIHRAWSCVCGNANDLREQAEILEALDKIMTADYAAAAGKDAARALEEMSSDIWLVGADAISEAGIKCEKIDYEKENKNTKIDKERAKALFNASVEKIKALNSKPFDKKTLALLKNAPAADAGKDETMTKEELIQTLEADEELKNALLEWAKERLEEPAAEEKPPEDESADDDEKKPAARVKASAETRRCLHIIALAGGKMTANAKKAIEDGLSAADFMVAEAIAGRFAQGTPQSNADELGKPSVPKTFAEMSGGKKKDDPKAAVTDEEKLRAMARSI